MIHKTFYAKFKIACAQTPPPLKNNPFFFFFSGEGGGFTQTKYKIIWINKAVKLSFSLYFYNVFGLLNAQLKPVLFIMLFLLDVDVLGV